MRKSITQEFEYGCGIACYAFALGITYQCAEATLGNKQAKSTRFWVKDLVKALHKADTPYHSVHASRLAQARDYPEGSIVLIRRSKMYPSGHYLIKHKGLWMDPWINLPENKKISQALSGFREMLPGEPMYVLLPG